MPPSSAARSAAEAEEYALFDAVAEAIVVAELVPGSGGALEVVYCNGGVEHTFRRKAAWLVGRPVTALMVHDSDEVRDHDTYVSRFLATGEAHVCGKQRVDVQGARADGTFVPLSLGLGCPRRPQHNVNALHFVASFHDLSEHRAKLEADARVAAEIRVLQSVLHEVRNPLQGVELSARLLHERLSALLGCVDCVDVLQAAVEDIESMLDCSEHMSRILNNVITIGQIEAQQLAPEQNNIDLADMLLRVASMMRIGANHGVTVSAQLDGAPPSVVGDQGLLMQVLVNLTSNSCKFTERGHVTLRAQAAGDGNVRFIVEDTGPGIPISEHEKIFSRYGVVPRDARKLGASSGLGLHLVHLIVELLGGRLRVESHPDDPDKYPPYGQTGTAMIIDLPLAPSKCAPAATRDPGRPCSATAATLPAHARVLVADDSKITRRLLASVLRSESVGGSGWFVAEATSGEEAIETLSTAAIPFDTVILDNQMGKDCMLGTEAAEELRRLGFRGALVLASGEKVDTPAADAIVMKPVPRHDELVKILVGALAAAHARKQERPSTLVQAMEPCDEARVVMTAPCGEVVVYCNDCWSRLCGYSADEAVGWTVKELLEHTETDEKLLRALLHSVHSNNAPAECMVVNEIASGERLMCTLRVSPLRAGDAEEATHLLGVLTPHRPAAELVHGQHLTIKEH